MADSGVNFWEKYNEEVARESGGGGIICNAAIEIGFKVFVPGMDQAQVWFPYNILDPKSRDAAFAKAKALGDSYGLKPTSGVQIHVPVETAVVRGQPATWKADRYFFTALWTDAAKQVVVPSLQKQGIPALPWTGWCALGFMDDPYKAGLGAAGMTDTDQEGNPRFPQVAYVTAVYKTQQEAAAAATAGGAGAAVATSTVAAPAAPAAPGNVSFPQGWDLASWQSCWPAIRQAKANGQEPVAIAKDYGVSVPDVMKVLASS